LVALTCGDAVVSGVCMIDFEVGFLVGARVAQGAGSGTDIG
jgi:hypothetical protein